MKDAKQLFIPDKIKVGFQKRDDTYTKKLAYVIYYDQKGVLRKETSWQSWRDKKISPVEVNNEPIEGFVLNKGVGGARHSYGWNARNEYIRVYDPRDFEFEITVANLLFILRECDCSRGKGLEGKFVYAWDGTELVLLPEISQDYQNSKSYTTLQGQAVNAKELIPGASYTTKKQDVLTYIGRFNYYFLVEETYRSYRSYGYGYDQKDEPKFKKSEEKGMAKKYVFMDKEGKFVFFNDLKHIATLNSDTVASDYAELLEKYNKSMHGSKPVNLFLKEKSKPKKDDYNYGETWDCEEANGVFVNYSSSNSYNYNNEKKIESIQPCHKFYFKDGVLFKEYANNGVAYAHGFSRNRSSDEKIIPWKDPTNQETWVELESGSKFKMTTYGGGY